MPRSAERPDVPILVCCASRGRPEELHATVKTFIETSSIADMAVYIDSDQLHMYMHAYDWKEEFGDRVMFTVDRQVGPNASLNALRDKYKDQYDIFGVTPDDSHFMVKDWDKWVANTFSQLPGGIGVVSPAHNDGNYCAYPYVTKKWIDIVGFYAMPEAHSFVWDTCVQLLGEATHIVYALPEEFRMEHARLQSENFADKLKVDEHHFLFWCAIDRQEIVKRLVAEMSRAMKWDEQEGRYVWSPPMKKWLKI